MLASHLVPNLTPEAIKAQIGKAVSDPNLAGLDHSRSLLLCSSVRRVGQFAGRDYYEPRFALLLAVRSPGTYRAAAKAWGLPVHSMDGDRTLIVGNDETMPEATREALNALLSDSMTSDFSVYVNAKLAASWGVRFGKDLFPDRFRRRRYGERVLTVGSRKALDQYQDLRCDLTFREEGLELNTILRAKPGTAAAKAFEQTLMPDASLLGHLPGTGGIVGFVSWEPNNAAELAAVHVHAALDNTLREIARYASATGLVKRGDEKVAAPDRVRAWLTRWLSLNSAVAFDLLRPATATGPNGLLICETSNPALFLAMLRNLSRDLEDVGIAAFARKSKTRLAVEFRENVRSHNGTAVHRLTILIDLPETNSPSPVIPWFLQSIRFDCEVACVGKRVVIELGAGKMNAVIDSLQAGKPMADRPANGGLRAQAVFPKGSNFCADINPGPLSRWAVFQVQSFAPWFLLTLGLQPDDLSARLEGLNTQPISICFSQDRGKQRRKAFIPYDTVLAVGKTLTPGAAVPVAP